MAPRRRQDRRAPAEGVGAASRSERDARTGEEGRGPQLAAALRQAEKAGATFVVQSAGRLGRDGAERTGQPSKIALALGKAGVPVRCLGDQAGERSRKGVA